MSVTANIAPRLCSEFQAACLAGNFVEALAIQDKLMPLHDALFVETSPAPVKYAGKLLNLCSDEVRLPLAPLSDATAVLIRGAMEHAELL